MFRPRLTSLALVAALLSSSLSHAQQPPLPSDEPAAPVAKPEKESKNVLHFVTEDWSLDLSKLELVMERTKDGCEECFTGTATFFALGKSWPIRLSGNRHQPMLGQILKSGQDNWKTAEGKRLPLFVQLDRSAPEAEVTALFPVHDLNGKSQACTFYLGTVVQGPAICGPAPDPDSKPVDPDQILADASAKSLSILQAEGTIPGETKDPSSPSPEADKSSENVLHFVAEEWSLELKDLRVVMARTRSGCVEGVLGEARLRALGQSWPIRLSGNPKQQDLGQTILNNAADWTSAEGKTLPLFVQLDRSKPEAEVTALFPVHDLNGKSQACTFYLGHFVPGPAVCGIEAGPDTKPANPDQILAEASAKSLAILNGEAMGRVERCDSRSSDWCGTEDLENRSRNSRKKVAILLGVGVGALALLAFVLRLFLLRA
jgi:hypothetical protein